jgi:hypothetical protein
VCERVSDGETRPRSSRPQRSPPLNQGCYGALGWWGRVGERFGFVSGAQGRCRLGCIQPFLLCDMILIDVLCAVFGV